MTHISSPQISAANIFTFATFVSGLAILAVVYTVTSVRYHFRIAVAPVPVYKITYFLAIIIGLSTLTVDLWFSEGWDTPRLLGDPLIIQAFMGFVFLCMVSMWMGFAFIYPQTFNKLNCERYARAMYYILGKGADDELRIIADELGSSAESIIESSHTIDSMLSSSEQKDNKRNQADWAYEILLMIGHRKFCRYIVSSAPGTVIAFFTKISDLKKYRIPFGEFAANISAEAFENVDSPIYHEDDGFRSGLFGYIKPFSKAVYGDYALVESLANITRSPLDLPYKLISEWDSNQLKAYCGCTLITIKSYLESSTYVDHSRSITNAMEIISNSCQGISKLNGTIEDNFDKDICKQLNEAIQFALKTTEIIDECWIKQLPSPKTTDLFGRNIYDSIARMILDIIRYSAHANIATDTVWSLQNTLVWSPVFCRFTKSKAMNIVYHKVRRLLYSDIKMMDSSPNHRSAKIICFCLNVMGLVPRNDFHTKKYYALHKLIIKWMVKNFHGLFVKCPDVAMACLQGTITYDKDNNQLQKTYLSTMSRESNTITLQLND